MKTMCHTPPARKPDQPAAKPRRRLGLWAAVAGLLVLLGGGVMFRGSASSWQPAPGSRAHSLAGNVTAASRTENAGEQLLCTQRIDAIQLGTRLRGRNPIREEAELVEPDPVTWRKVSLYMTKESGLGLWIDLLRPLAWIEEHGATPGGGIYLEMHEMGAVGDAKVMDIGPCPAIQPGDGGAVVIGRFKHQAEANSGVVHLELEDQIEPTGVTDNHPYWSVDRQEFVPVGQLRVGELVDTVFGLKHVVSVTPIDHNGFLYNLETTEHVYRVGSLATLVHNACPMPIPKGGRQIRQTVRSRGMKVDRLFANRNDAMNWAASQLGPTKERIHNTKGQWIGWRNAVNDTVYWHHGDWRSGPGTSRFPHLNCHIGPNSGHLFLGDKIFNTGMWLDFCTVVGL